VTRNERRLLLGFGFIGLATLVCTLAVGIGLLAMRPASTPLGTIRQAAQAVQGRSAPATPPAPARPMRPATPAAALEPLPLPGIDTPGGAHLTRLYEQVNPGVVSLGVEHEVDFGGQRFRQSGGGSGFVFDERHIVTNNHVAGGVETVEVVFFDGQHREGRVIGSDSYSDLAVVRVEDMPDAARALPLITDFDDLKVGQPVIAIGNPFGKANSLTSGIISALGRTIPTGLETGFSIPQTIQTDAAINPGNSGGPLLDLRGQVLGINAQINTSLGPNGGPPSNSGVGFAIPASIVARVAPVLIEKGEYAWPYLGVAGLPQERFTVGVAEANKLPDARGAYILGVRPDGPSVGVLRGARNAPRADEQAADDYVPLGGDVVTAIDGAPVQSFDDLIGYIALETTPDQSVELTVLRDGRAIALPVTLKRRPKGD